MWATCVRSNNLRTHINVHLKREHRASTAVLPASSPSPSDAEEDEDEMAGRASLPPAGRAVVRGLPCSEFAVDGVGFVRRGDGSFFRPADARLVLWAGVRG
jgi:hypothetical protein